MIINSTQPMFADNPNIKIIASSSEITTAASPNTIQVYPVATGIINKWSISPTKPESPINNELWLKSGSSIYKYVVKPFANYEVYIPIATAEIYDGSSWTVLSTRCYNNDKWN